MKGGSSSSSMQSIAVGDIDGDSNLDINVGNYEGENEILFQHVVPEKSNCPK